MYLKFAPFSLTLSEGEFELSILGMGFSQMIILRSFISVRYGDDILKTKHVSVDLFWIHIKR